LIIVFHHSPLTNPTNLSFHITEITPREKMLNPKRFKYDFLWNPQNQRKDKGMIHKTKFIKLTLSPIEICIYHLVFFAWCIWLVPKLSCNLLRLDPTGRTRNI